LSDDAIYVARANRLAPITAVASRLEPHDSRRGRDVAKRLQDSVVAPQSTLLGLLGTLVDHGIAVGRLSHEIADDGSLVSMRLHEWPLEHVYVDAPAGDALIARTTTGSETIVHGDGSWVVVRRMDRQPWRYDAALVPASLVGYAHAEGLADWAGATRAHGLARVMGELPEGYALATSDGALTPEANAFLRLLQDVASGEAAAGIRPAGGKVDFLTHASSAWQVFRESALSREKAAARIYLGTDAVLGSVGGAPGVDISELFGVASTKIQGDIQAIERAMRTGVYEPWTAINYGDSKLAPSLRYELPDPDADRRRDERARGLERLTTTINQMREAGLEVNAGTVSRLAEEYGAAGAVIASAPAAPPAEAAPASSPPPA
jgi:phage gp29-like protein